MSAFEKRLKDAFMAGHNAGFMQAYNDERGVETISAEEAWKQHQRFVIRRLTGEQ